MKTKLTFLLSLTFLFLFSGSVYGEEEVKREYWDNGKLKRSDLTVASLTDTNLTDAVLCKTIIPSGQEDDSGCKR
jgi:hypothetical protein